MFEYTVALNSEFDSDIYFPCFHNTELQIMVSWLHTTRANEDFDSVLTVPDCQFKYVSSKTATVCIDNKELVYHDGDIRHGGTEIISVAGNAVRVRERERERERERKRKREGD